MVPFEDTVASSFPCVIERCARGSAASHVASPVTHPADNIVDRSADTSEGPESATYRTCFAAPQRESALRVRSK